MALLSSFNKDTANNLQLDAGIICKGITDPHNPTAGELKTKCIGATSGGAEFEVTPEITNIFEDLDDAKGKYKGGVEITNIDIVFSFTMKEMTAENFKLAMGCADITKIGSKSSEDNLPHTLLTPRLEIKDEDFIDNICWYGRKRNGEKVCIVLKNVFNEGGLSYTSESAGKGSLEVELHAFFDLSNPDKVPYEVIIFGASANLGE
ncbi:MAG: hypothetical protein MR691_15710 [Clostridium sp.]|nr:hypothetical protein [Clostridium sp.]